VVAGDVYAAAPHVGRGGWTWYTGSAGWLYQLLLESLLGLRRHGDRLRVEPLLPRHWPGFELRYRHGGSTVYEIRCRRAGPHEPAVVRIDGQPSVDGTIPLHDDGRTVGVEVVVSQDGAPRH
jgi:cellobiose phosphorylase